MRNLSYENEFYSQVHSNVNHTHFHMKDFALGLGLKQRQKATRKWPIAITPTLQRKHKTPRINESTIYGRLNYRNTVIERADLTRSLGLATIDFLSQNIFS